MRLLDGRDLLAPLPTVGRRFIDDLERSGLAGRGGASFPTATKWRAVAERSRGDAVVLVNGAEGEPQSKKDRTLMSVRPHLVLDGAFIAARVLGARRIVLYIGERHTAARGSMLAALAHRSEPERGIVSLAAAPPRYVAGAETAAVHFVDEGVATPTTAPPYPFERAILVQNVETLAHVAALARSGEAPDSVLLTMAGGVGRPGVIEVAMGTTVGEAIARSGGPIEAPRAVLIGGYFGRWMQTDEAWRLPLTREAGLGCGVMGVLPASRCPVCEVAAIMRYLAAESSAQCGPCFFGLRALAASCAKPAELGRLKRWATEVRGRGACKHPDGAAIFLSSAMEVFAAEFEHHEATHQMRRVA